MITVITVRGTGEKQNAPNNMLSFTTRAMDAKQYEFIDLDYPASIGPVPMVMGDSEIESIEVGIKNLAATIRNTSNLVVLFGYSLGAMVVARFLERQFNGEYSDCVVIAAGLLASPLRKGGDSVGNICGGYGIAGQRGRWPEKTRTFEVANPFDPISCLVVGSPLRTLSDQLTHLTFKDGLAGWFKEMRRRMMTGDWQPTGIDWSKPAETFDLYRQAFADLDNYTKYGQHTNYNRWVMPLEKVTYSVKLAQMVSTVKKKPE